MAITLRAAGDDDEALLLRLYAAVRDDLAALAGDDAGQLDSLIRFQYRARRTSYERDFPGLEPFLILAGGEPVGMLMTAPEAGPEAGALRLVDIALVPAARGRGIGTAVLERLQARAAEDGLALRLRVAADNPARRLYRRLGFRVTADEGASLAMAWTPAPDCSIG